MPVDPDCGHIGRIFNGHHINFFYQADQHYYTINVKKDNPTSTKNYCEYRIKEQDFIDFLRNVDFEVSKEARSYFQVKPR